MHHIPNPPLQEPRPAGTLRVLAIDVGGSHVKIRSSAGGEERRFDSGLDMGAEVMTKAVLKMADGLAYDAISMGYPGRVLRNRIEAEPVNLGKGWVDFAFAQAFGVSLRIVNDALMQAVGSYRGGRMLFLGLGTGLGAAIVAENVCLPLEIAHLPYRNGRTYEDYLGRAGRKKRGHKKWRKHVHRVVALFDRALEPDYVVIGGGNVDHLDRLPPKSFRGDNQNAFKGGFRIWTDSRLIL